MDDNDDDNKGKSLGVLITEEFMVRRNLNV